MTDNLRRTNILWKYICVLLCTLIGLIFAPPADKEIKAVYDEFYDTDNLNDADARNTDYARYVTQISKELENDPAFVEIMRNSKREDISKGKPAEEIFRRIGHDVRRKLDEIKRREVAYQREQIRKNRKYMMKTENSWNPINMEDKDSFGLEDHRKLMIVHSEVMSFQDAQRREKFKEHEMKKEHERREKLKSMTEGERMTAQKEMEARRTKKHEKLHDPGNKAQMQEVWEQEDGLDPESFDARTFFNLRDKNSDGQLDQFELDTFFLHDLDKIYKDTDPDMDPAEREEEMHRMREYLMKKIDTNKDDMVSLHEFLAIAQRDVSEDEEWKPLTEKKQFSEEEFSDFEEKFRDVNGGQVDGTIDTTGSTI